MDREGLFRRVVAAVGKQYQGTTHLQSLETASGWRLPLQPLPLQLLRAAAPLTPAGVWGPPLARARS